MHLALHAHIHLALHAHIPCCCCAAALTTAAAATAEVGAWRHYFDEWVLSVRKRRAFAGVCVGHALSNDGQTYGNATHAHSISALLILGANITAFLCSVLESVSVTLNGQNLVSSAGFFWYPTMFHLFHLVKPLHNCSVMQSQTKTVDRDIWFNERCFDTWRASLMFFSWKLALLDKLTHSQCMNVNKVNAIDHFPPYFQVPTCARCLTKFIFSMLSCACTRRCNRRWPYWFMIPLWSSSCSKIFLFCLFAYVPLSMELCSASLAPDARTQSLHVSLS